MSLGIFLNIMCTIHVIAAINGHCFAGVVGSVLACDYRVMTSGNAWFCLNETCLSINHAFSSVSFSLTRMNLQIDLGVSLSLSMAALINYKLPYSFIVRKARTGDD